MKQLDLAALEDGMAVIRRFGVDAMRFVNSSVGRELNLRGINARIVTGGTVRTGDAIRVAGVRQA